MRSLVIAGTLVAILASASQAQAVGCLSGAVAGGVAGHYAGHHAILGAIGGCIVGHHLAKQQKLEKQRQLQTAPTQPATQSGQ